MIHVVWIVTRNCHLLTTIIYRMKLLPVLVERQDNRKRPLSDFIFAFFLFVFVFLLFVLFDKDQTFQNVNRRVEISFSYCDYSRILIYLINLGVMRYSCIHSSNCKTPHQVYSKTKYCLLTFARFGPCPLTLLMVSTSHVIMNYFISLYALGEADVG